MKRIFLTFAAMLLMSVCTFAQSGTSLKGDVNGDGKVDVADIVAVIEIMKNGGGTAGETRYYWYGGQTDPEIDRNIVTEPGVSGWRLVTDGYEYNSTINPIYDEEYKTVVYCALPKDGTVKVKDDQGTIYNPIPWIYVKDITFNGITYGVYKAEDNEQFSGYTIFK